MADAKADEPPTLEPATLVIDGEEYGFETFGAERGWTVAFHRMNADGSDGAPVGRFERVDGGDVEPQERDGAAFAILWTFVNGKSRRGERGFSVDCEAGSVSAHAGQVMGKCGKCGARREVRAGRQGTDKAIFCNDDRIGPHWLRIKHQ